MVSTLLAGLVLGALLVGAVTTAYHYNRLARLEKRLDTAWTAVTTRLARRRDLAREILDIAKSHGADGSGDLLVSVTDADADTRVPATPEARMVAETRLARAVADLLVLADGHAALGADARFQRLRDALREEEVGIAAACEQYNDAVIAFNNAATTIPGSLIAVPLRRRKRHLVRVPRSEEEVRGAPR